MEEIRGIIDYRIHLQPGSDHVFELNGSFTNNFNPGRIFGEVARKVDPVNTELVGNYLSTHYDDLDNPFELTLRIHGGPEELLFTWHELENPTDIYFEGRGYMFEPDRILVYYWSAVRN